MSVATMERFQENLDRLKIGGQDGLRLWHALPEAERHRIEVTTADARYFEGTGPFISRKPKRKPRTIPSKIGPPVRTHGNPRCQGDEWRRATEVLASIPAETYLEILVPDSEPHRGKCRCPWPNDHADNNPSATYRDASFFCHVCGQGGGIFQLSAELSGHHDHGPEFHELRRWIAERLLGVTA